MKKYLKAENLVIMIMGIIIIVLVATIGDMNNIIKDKELACDKRIEQLNKDNEKLVEEKYELEQNVYNMFEKKPYSISLQHDGSTITYKQDKFGLFDSYHKMVTTVTSIEE